MKTTKKLKINLLLAAFFFFPTTSKAEKNKTPAKAIVGGVAILGMSLAARAGKGIFNEKSQEKNTIAVPRFSLEKEIALKKPLEKQEEEDDDDDDDVVLVGLNFTPGGLCPNDDEIEKQETPQ